MQFQDIIYEKKDGVAKITINRSIANSFIDSKSSIPRNRYISNCISVIIVCAIKNI